MEYMHIGWIVKCKYVFFLVTRWEEAFSQAQQNGNAVMTIFAVLESRHQLSGWLKSSPAVYDSFFR